MGRLMQAANGGVYGTTAMGGANGSGTIFKLTLSPHPDAVPAFSVVQNFPFSSSASGSSGLTQASDGTLYGTTTWAGEYGLGSIFQIAPAAVRHTIAARPNSRLRGSVFGSGSYVRGTTVTLRAVPRRGRRFMSWQENSRVVSRSAIYRFPAARGRSLVAVFR